MRPPPRSTDLPLAAHAKAIAALDEFDTVAAEYVAILDTLRALLARGSGGAAVADALGRGDTLASRAALCARRLAPVREALARPAMRGPRADVIRKRLGGMTHRAALLGAAAADAAARCNAERTAAGKALARLQQPAAGGKSALYTHPRAPHSPLTLDTRG